MGRKKRGKKYYQRINKNLRKKREFIKTFRNSSIFGNNFITAKILSYALLNMYLRDNSSNEYNYSYIKIFNHYSDIINCYDNNITKLLICHHFFRISGKLIWINAKNTYLTYIKKFPEIKCSLLDNFYRICSRCNSQLRDCHLCHGYRLSKYPYCYQFIDKTWKCPNKKCTEFYDYENFCHTKNDECYKIACGFIIMRKSI